MNYSISIKFIPLAFYKMLLTINNSSKKIFLKSFLVLSSTICKIWAKKCALLKWQKKHNTTELLEHGVNLLFPMVTKKLAQKTRKKIPQHPLSRKLVYIFKQTSTISWSTPCRVRKSACLPFVGSSGRQSTGKSF